MSEREFVSGYDVKAGDKFKFRICTFTAREDAKGEFNAYIPCEIVGTIVVPHGDYVEILERANAKESA